LLAVVLSVVAPALADDPQPSQLGGAFPTAHLGTVSYGPRLLPGMLALDWQTGSVGAVGIGGLAYGICAWSGKPYELGLAGFLGAQTTSPTAISTGVVVTALRYVAVGVRWGVTGGVHVRQLVVGPSVAF